MNLNVSRCYSMVLSLVNVICVPSHEVTHSAVHQVSSLSFYQEDLSRFSWALCCLKGIAMVPRYHSIFDLFVNKISLNALTETEMFHITSDVWKMPFRRGLSHMRKGFWLKLCLDECVMNLPKLSQIQCGVWTNFPETCSGSVRLHVHSATQKACYWYAFAVGRLEQKRCKLCTSCCLLFTKSLLWWKLPY